MSGKWFLEEERKVEKLKRGEKRDFLLRK